MQEKIVITGGGTGGHVFPALAIAEELKKRGVALSYVGSATGLEAKLVPERGIPFHAIRTGAVKNQSPLTVLKTLFLVCLAVLKSLRILRKEKPQAVLGVGGYVSVPVCIAAFLLRIPIYLQEQNVSVGIANRFLGKLCRKIFLGFEQARTYFSESKCVVTGNPVRQEFSRADFPPVDPGQKCLLILGGSQGAHSINELMIDLLEELNQKYPGLVIIHQTGQKDFDQVKTAYAQKFKGKAEVLPFISDMAGSYAKASLVISRSGALTVSELIQVARPAIFIPYPRKGQNDQTDNAYLLQTQGVSRVVEQGEKFKERFWSTFVETYQPNVLRTMAINASRLRKQNAVVSIGDELEKALGKSRNV